MATRIYSAGQLSERITLRARAEGTGALGERNGAWVDVATVWAKVEPLSGRDFLAAGAMQHRVDTRVVIRWRSGITADMRLLWRGIAYEMASAVPIDGGRSWIEIMAVAGVRDGRA